jgi:hypothetical protein
MRSLWPHLEDDARRYLDGKTLREYLRLLDAGFSGCERLAAGGSYFDMARGELVEPPADLKRAIEIRAKIEAASAQALDRDFTRAFSDAVRQERPGRKGGEDSAKDICCQMAEAILDRGAAGAREHGRMARLAELVRNKLAEQHGIGRSIKTVRADIQLTVREWEAHNPGM